MSRIGLGSAQFGMPYGIANSTGQIAQHDQLEILRIARSSGIDLIDTAVAYDESERALGKLGVGDFDVISKLPPFPGEGVDVDTWVRQTVANSLKDLDVTELYALLLHNPRDLVGSHGPELRKALNELKEDGLVKKTGISVYRPGDLDELFHIMPFDVVQLPFNIFDTRMKESGWLDRLKEMECEIHARSVFLQGLLLCSDRSRPNKFGRWRDAWKSYDAWLASTGLTPLVACIRFVLEQDGIDRVIVGVDSASQFEEVVSAAVSEVDLNFSGIRIDDDRLIEPSTWEHL